MHFPIKMKTVRSNTYLEEKLHSLDGGNSCFRDGSGNTASQEVLGEGNCLFTHLQVLSVAVRSPGRWGLPVQLKWPSSIQT